MGKKPWPVGVPKNMTAEQRVQRARNAAPARTSTDHHIKALAGKTLTDEQKRELEGLLRAETAGAE